MLCITPETVTSFADKQNPQQNGIHEHSQGMTLSIYIVVLFEFDAEVIYSSHFLHVK